LEENRAGEITPVRGKSKWRDGRPMALLFAATIALPSLALAVLAYRALDSDRQLEERLWRERMQDAARGAYGFLERRVLDARSHAETLARGEEPGVSRLDGIISVVLSPQIKLSPSSAFAWLPDGRAPAATLPPELEQTEIRELRLTNVGQAVTIYADLLHRTPAQWRGWIHLRLARAYSRAGEPAKSTAALKDAARRRGPGAGERKPAASAARHSHTRGRGIGVRLLRYGAAGPPRTQSGAIAIRLRGYGFSRVPLTAHRHSPVRRNAAGRTRRQ
jgi:hypothetical protein